MFIKEKPLKSIDLQKVLRFINDFYEDYTILYSSKKTKYSGKKSIFAFGLIEDIEDLSLLQEKLKENSQDYFFGYFGYEAFEKENNNESFIKFPKLKFQKYQNHIIFDHELNKVEFLLQNEKLYQKITSFDKKNEENDRLSLNFSSNMTDNEYIEKVKQIKTAISKGDYYQLNLTRKYFGEFKQKINIINVFLDLIKEFPVPYGALIRYGKKYIISSSPERFIKIEDSKIQSRPIKGTIKKSLNNDAKVQLSESAKDKAENLMIVDLMRNDLTLSSLAGSVKVDNLYSIDEFTNLFHMSSDIFAKKAANFSNLQVIKNAFPPASMTGAPKITVKTNIKQFERLERGVYSGAIGYFKGNNYCDFNVVIRTILIEENKFEYQTGGGIIYDSDPLLELEETKIKSAKIRKVLGLD